MEVFCVLRDVLLVILTAGFTSISFSCYYICKCLDKIHNKLYKLEQRDIIVDKEKNDLKDGNGFYHRVTRKKLL